MPNSVRRIVAILLVACLAPGHAAAVTATCYREGSTQFPQPSLLTQTLVSLSISSRVDASTAIRINRFVTRNSLFPRPGMAAAVIALGLASAGIAPAQPLDPWATLQAFVHAAGRIWDLVNDPIFLAIGGSVASTIAGGWAMTVKAKRAFARRWEWAQSAASKDYRAIEAAIETKDAGMLPAIEKGARIRRAELARQVKVADDQDLVKLTSAGRELPDLTRRLLAYEDLVIALAVLAENRLWSERKQLGKRAAPVWAQELESLEKHALASGEEGPLALELRDLEKELVVEKADAGQARAAIRAFEQTLPGLWRGPMGQALDEAEYELERFRRRAVRPEVKLFKEKSRAMQLRLIRRVQTAPQLAGMLDPEQQRSAALFNRRLLQALSSAKSLAGILTERKALEKQAKTSWLVRAAKAAKKSALQTLAGIFSPDGDADNDSLSDSISLFDISLGLANAEAFDDEGLGDKIEATVDDAIRLLHRLREQERRLREFLTQAPLPPGLSLPALQVKGLTERLLVRDPDYLRERIDAIAQALANAANAVRDRLSLQENQLAAAVEAELHGQIAAASPAAITESPRSREGRRFGRHLLATHA